MSIKSGLPLVQYKQSLFTTAPFLAVATNTLVTKLIGTVRAGSYIACWNYANTVAGGQFASGGFGVITSTSIYGGASPVILGIIDVASLGTQLLLKGNDIFTFTLATDTPIYINWFLQLTGGTWSASVLPVDGQMNSLQLIKIS